MAEDEQRLFTEKINKTFSEHLTWLMRDAQKKKCWDTLTDLIKIFPDAKKLVKYWICLAHVEPFTSSVGNIISVYEKAILAGAQPVEEMRHAIVDILTMMIWEKVKFGEKFEKTCATKEHIQEVNTEDIGLNLESRKPEMGNNIIEMWYLKILKKGKLIKQKIQTTMLKIPIQKLMFNKI